MIYRNTRKGVLELLNEWVVHIYIVLYCVLLCTQSALQSCVCVWGGGLSQMCCIMQRVDSLLMHPTEHIIVNYTLFWTGHHWRDTRWEIHWIMFIYKVLLRLLSEYLQTLLKLHLKTHATRSSNYISLIIPRIKTTYGRPLLNFLPQMIVMCYKGYWN